MAINVLYRVLGSVSMDYSVKIVIILTIGFALASLFGYIARRAQLPSILGYLLAGYVIGPHAPGFVADISISEQLAEVGVILMLFGVGLHFKLQDLMNVKRVAIPGAIAQTAIAAITGTLFVSLMGWSIEAGIIIGLAIGVASTVVLVRVLSDNNLLTTTEGHIAVGWLIVEDIFTVAILILLPLLALFFQGGDLPASTIASTLLLMVGKFIVLAVIMFTYGHKVVAYLLTSIARLRSQELFTITILALTFVIATGSAFLFGTSIALGAFIAGMIIGQTDVRHQAFVNSLPLKDVFAVLFFLSIGMLFNPMALIEYPLFFAGILAIILLVKPLTAFFIVIGLEFSTKIALTVAVALAQIGEFSFILAEEAFRLQLLPDQGFDILIACALVSISLNPLLFRLIHVVEEKYFKPRALRNLRAKILKEFPTKITQVFESQIRERPVVVVVGFGPIGQAVSHILEKLHVMPVIIEQNIDVVHQHKNQRQEIIYGDASQSGILETAHVATAKCLIITNPETAVATSIIKSAQHVNPLIKILSRVQYVSEEALMEDLHVEYICSEKETLKAFTKRVVRLVRSIS